MDITHIKKIIEYLQHVATQTLITTAILWLAFLIAAPEIIHTALKSVLESQNFTASDLILMVISSLWLAILLTLTLLHENMNKWATRHRILWLVMPVLFYLIITYILSNFSLGAELRFTLSKLAMAFLAVTAAGILSIHKTVKVVLALLKCWCAKWLPMEDWLSHITSHIKWTNRTWAIAALFVIITTGLFWRFEDFGHDIDGPHAFRQSHVASNIQYMQKSGLFSRPELLTKNGDFGNKNFCFYDTPIYQGIVYLITQALHTGIVVSGRMINILLFPICILLTVGLLRQLGFSLSTVVAAALIMASSPLHTFYSRAIIPDVLAFTASLAMTYSYFRFNDSRKAVWLVLSLVFMLTATLIKNSIPAPFLLAISGYLFLQQLSATIKKPSLWVLNLSFLAAVIAYKLWMTYTNTGGFSTPEEVWDWYSGTIEQRLNPASYLPFLQRLAKMHGTPFLLPFFVTGLVAFFLKTRQSNNAAFHILLLFGTVFATLFYFNVNYIHDYYQISWTYLYSVICAQGIVCLYRFIKTEASYSVAVLLIGIFVVLHVVASQTWYRYDHWDDPPMQTAGKWLREKTDQDDFIVLLSENSFNPSNHWRFQREGYNIAEDRLTVDWIKNIHRENPGYRKYWLFIPDRELKGREIAVKEGLKRIDTKSIDHHEYGTLYLLY